MTDQEYNFMMLVVSYEKHMKFYQNIVPDAGAFVRALDFYLFYRACIEYGKIEALKLYPVWDF